jgi:isoleucyl-tRNA synthetase
LRRAHRAAAVLDHLFDSLARWLAPVLCFTAEEAWLARHGATDAETSVHLMLYPDVPADWSDPVLGDRWAKIREVRRVVTGAIELERAQKRLGASLQAAVRLFATPEIAAILADIDLPEICIASSVVLDTGMPPEGSFTLDDVPGVAAVVGLADGEKCQRCWRVLPEVGHVQGHDDLCGRCAEVIVGSAA